MRFVAFDEQPEEALKTPLGKLLSLATLIGEGSPRAAAQWNAIAPGNDERMGKGLRYYLFWQALGHRVVAKDTLQRERNLYLSSFKVPQIDLFNLMATQMPLVTSASVMCNQMLASKIQHGERVTLIDVGIGTGRQEVALLHLLAGQHCRPDVLRIVGVEPSREALQIAQRDIEVTARALHLNVVFDPRVGLIEDFAKEQWATLRGDGHLLVNAAFALHHLSYADRPKQAGRMSDDAKQDVLRRLRQLQPELMVLAEPDSDHNTPSLTQRLANAWHHFGLVFDVIDRTDIAEDAKSAMKVFFFGREIDDIVAGPEVSRSERHESSVQWKDRLHRAGFVPRLPWVSTESASAAVQIERGDGLYTLSHAQKSVLAILAVGA